MELSSSYRDEIAQITIERYVHTPVQKCLCTISSNDARRTVREIALESGLSSIVARKSF